MQLKNYKYIFVFIFSAALLSATVQADTVPIQTLLVGESDFNFSFSPDSRHIAYVHKSSGESHLLVVDANSLKLKHRFKLPKGSVHDLAWINQERILLELDGKIQSVNMDGSDMVTVKGFQYLSYEFRNGVVSIGWDIVKRPKLVSLLPDHEQELLISSYDKDGYAVMERINIHTGEKIKIADGNENKITQWVANRCGEVVLGLRYNDDRVEFFVKKPNSDQYVLHSKYKNNDHYNLNFSGASFLEGRVFFVSNSYDDDKVYVAESISGDRFRISDYSISKKQVQGLVHEDLHYDIGGLNTEIGLVFDDATQKLIGIRYYRIGLHTHWLDKRLQKVQEGIDSEYPDFTNSILSWSSDLSKFIIYQSSPNNYAKVYLYAPAKQQFSLLTDSSAYPNENLMPEKQVVHYVSSDGARHESYLTLPVNAGDAPYPLIEIPHGGPYMRSHLAFNPGAAYYALHGYAVLEVNYRGSTGFGRSYLMDGIRGLGSVMLDDIADSAKWMLSEYNVDPARVYIFGVSYGGYAALMSLARHPDLYSGAVSMAAPLDLIYQIKTYKQQGNEFAYAFWNTAVGNIKKEKKRLKSISPLFNIDKLNKPYLVFHGKLDPVVSVSQVNAFKRALRKANLPGKVEIFKDEGHDLNRKENQVYFLEKTLSFFNQLGQQSVH